MKWFYFLVYFSYYAAFSQNINSSKVFVSTCYQKHQCFALNENAGTFLFYNQASHELFIVMDFKKFKMGNDSIDEWLEDLDDTKLIFNGVLNSENLLTLTPHNSKTFMVNGIISFNNASSFHSFELTLFEVSDQGILYQNSGQDYFDRIRANLQFSFYPKEFLVHKKTHHLKKSISLSIYNGFINKVRPEIEFMLKGKD